MKNLLNWANKPFAAYPDITERIVYLFIFLFPIAGMSIRHWITNIFNILMLIALFSIRKQRTPLLQQEKLFLWICAAYFSMFVISSLANGWGKPQTYYLGTELRFIMVIPIYILLRRYSDCSTWLLRGAILGGFFLIGQAFYDIYVLNDGRALGVYSKNIIGPLSVLIGYWALYSIWHNFTQLKWPAGLIITLSIISAFTTAALSSSRGGYVGFIFTGLACVMFFSKPRWMIASFASLCLIAFLFYQNIGNVNGGINTAKDEIQQYFHAKEHATDDSSKTSVGVRLEMIRTGMLFVLDSPFVGIGPGNYSTKTQTYIKEGKAHPETAKHNYPHNAFIEVASAKGIIGLITLLLLFYYPAFIFIKGYKKCKHTAVLGLIHITAISAFSLTDHSVLVMNNYSSILLLGLSIFLSSHIRACNLNSH